MKPVVFIPEPIAAVGLDLLSKEFRCLAPWEDGTEPARSSLYSSDAVIVRLFTVSKDDLDEAANLKVIAKHGVGLDNIDCQAATDHGIPVVYTPTANANAVAEHTIALLLALVRQIVPANLAAVSGRFDQRGQFKGTELAGKTLGVIGLGRVGSIVADIASHGLNMRVLGYDPYLSDISYQGSAKLVTSMKSLLSQSDAVTLHVSLNEETRNMINDTTLSWFKKGSRLVNTSRGAVVDEEALLKALSSRQLAGAALDVYAQEPLPADHPLITAPNTLLTPHISSSTEESLERMSFQAAQGVIDVLKGRRPEFIANPEVLD